MQALEIPILTFEIAAYLNQRSEIAKKQYVFFVKLIKISCHSQNQFISINPRPSFGR